MKKRTILIIGAIGSVLVSGLIFAAICTGMQDFSSKVSFLQNSFETEKPYFTSCPKDEELKKLYSEHKNAFHQLANMAQDDKVSSFRKGWIFHQDCSMVFFPYVLGEFPSDKLISREKFFKYLALMNECKIQDFGYECDDFKTEHPIKAENPNEVISVSDKSNSKDDSSKETDSRGIKFYIYQEYNYDKVPEDKFIATDKHIYYFKDDKGLKTISDTDSLKSLDISKFAATAAYYKLDPHWVIKKSNALQNFDPEKNE
ncbi:MAG: hypothetical protein SFY67_05580 [Candidatus Melainabacteria bacterium]|nr:hypothetical protein [Candidatus Melainabacteria bacterium]